MGSEQIRYYPHSETLNAQLRLSDFDGDALRQAAHLPAVAVGGDGTFTFTGVDGLSINTINGNGSQTLSNLTPGLYTIRENFTPDWNLTSNTCNVQVVAGQTVSCVVTNTKQSSISGIKYNDANRDGTMDNNEKGLKKLIQSL